MRMGVGMVMTEFGAAEDVSADIEQLENTMYVFFLFYFTCKIHIYLMMKKIRFFKLFFFIIF